MSYTTQIPRFLLPQRGVIWRTSTRNASTKIEPKSTASKPLTLEKPSKFTPPSHPQRLKKATPRYGAPLSAEEVARHRTKKYPNMMPPEGTVMHKILHSRSLHLYFTLSTLFTLASIVFITNFKRNSPFADLLPAWQQFFLHPIAFFRTFFEVMRLDSERMTEETKERRARKVDDVQKRAMYRKAHGLENEQGFGGWSWMGGGGKGTDGKAESEERLVDMLEPGVPVGDMIAAGIKDKTILRSEVEGTGEDGKATKKPLKKWLGIW